MVRAKSVLILFGALTVATPLAPAVPGGVRNPPGPIVHEWGTFTSVAGEDGRPVEWVPQTGPSDLPSFVQRLRMGPKALLSGTVRMETPVIYFYVARDTKVTVTVRFRNGVVTEWYPRATVTPSSPTTGELGRAGFEGSIVWRDVNVVPRAWANFPIEDRPSHYYAARETDASPIENATDREKFLFYRGVGHFAPPVSATIAPDGSVVVASNAALPLGQLILFGNHGGRIAFEVQYITSTAATFAPGPATGDPVWLVAELETVLIREGLYPREAKAMVATWRDSWFEEGTRLFYVVPRHTIDAILPLEMDPVPAEVARVFVGRIELITRATLDRVRHALAAHDEVTLRKHGRFLHRSSSAWSEVASACVGPIGDV